ncbi:MAG: hypothetical protein U1E23_10165 [Reyranellaceae bacterium]
MRLAVGLSVLALAVLPRAAWAEERWLGCRFMESGKPRTFVMVFDDLRGIASLLEGGSLVAGAGTTINYQSLRTRFPDFGVTYSRNDGSLSVSPQTGGLVSGECRRITAPAGAPPLQ